MEIPDAGVERIRSFVGVALPEGHRELLAAHLERGREAAPGFRWVRAEGLHLTLRFLGSVDRPALERLSDGMRSVRWQPFLLGLGAMGTFGRGSAVRVVFLQVAAGREELAGLAGAVEELCLAVGLPAEERAYNPHLTLARARDRRGAPLPQLPPSPQLAPWRVERFSLYRSRPGPGGSVYTVLEEFPPS